MTQPREIQTATTFALRAGPGRGESLESFVHWCARRLCCSPAAVTEHLGLPLSTSAGHLNRDLADPDLARAAPILGVPTESLRDATLRKWDWLRLRPERGKRGSPLGAWQRGSGARYCYACLNESEGRWQLAWYLHWTFACPKHGVLLHSTCRGCGRAPRTQKPNASSLTDANALDLNCGCGSQAIRSISESRLSHDDPRLATQQRIARVLSLAPTDQAVAHTAGVATPASEWLTDLTLVTHFIVLSLVAEGNKDAFTASTSGYDVEELAKPTAWRASLAARGARSTTRGVTPQVLQRELVTSAADVGACVTLADTLLASDDVDHLRAGLLWMPTRWRVQTQQRAARGQFACSDTLMEAIAGHVRQTRDNWFAALRAKHRLRPELDDHVTQHFPAALHPRVRPWLTVIRGDLSEAAVIAGLLAGSRHPKRVHDTARHLGLAHVASDLADAWVQLTSSPRARPDIKTIAGWLLDDGYQRNPVHFASRREQLHRPTPLPDSVARALARLLQTRNSPTLRWMASLYVWERVTGSDALLTPEALSAYGAFRVRYRRVRERWNRCLPLPLRDFLSDISAGMTTPPGIRPFDSTRGSDSASDWHIYSAMEPHLLPTPLVASSVLAPTDLLGASATQIAQALAADPEAGWWGRVRLLWMFGLARRVDPTAPWLAEARHALAELAGVSEVPDSTGSSPCDALLVDLLTILRTREVPHDCIYEG
ncbi:TniQ family protein [Nocardioides glacieisoli]|nr:TniQ family protein [Nocardioides glacieisoli]